MSIASRNHSHSTASDEFAEKAAQLREQFAELIECCPGAASEKLKGLKDNAADLYSKTTERAAEMTKLAMAKTVETVKKYPVQTALVAVGAGLLTWWLLSRRECEDE